MPRNRIDNLIHREDFSLGPISIDFVEKNLYLGGLAAAKDIDTLKKYSITHILTIDTCPLPRKVLSLKQITNKYIQLCDLPKEDLISHFDETYEFIEEGISKGAVLVHCYYGVSRSATVVIAYLMKKYNLDCAQALAELKKKRSIVLPNNGFINQLAIYHKMNYKIDVNNMLYKKLRLQLAADRVRKVKVLTHEYMDLIKPDPGVTQSQPEPNNFRCKKCRRILASESNLITHNLNDAICNKVYFIEPLEWMNVAKTTNGRLHCPKCNSKVGSFCWIMGCRCLCGKEVAPAFYLIPSKVDFTNVVKNVEMTF